jgi:RHS repeat-associated protein
MYTWNTRNQLVSLSGPGVTASFQYDALGRRKSKTVNGVTTDFLYDGSSIVQELSSGSVQANLLLGLGIDEVLQRIETASTSHFLTDGLGSTLALTDSAGVVQTEYTYEPFGNTTTSGAASANPSQYTGRENDGTGLYYYRARYYHPGLQRFISQDPIGFRGKDINLYTYVHNNPTNFTDPYGLLGVDTVMKWLLKQATKQAGKFLGKKVSDPINEGENRSPEQNQMETDTDQDGVPDFTDPDDYDDRKRWPKDNDDGSPIPNNDDDGGPAPDNPPNNPPDRY